MRQRAPLSARTVVTDTRRALLPVSVYYRNESDDRPRDSQWEREENTLVLRVEANGHDRRDEEAEAEPERERLRSEERDSGKE